MYLIDTNVISELRKMQFGKANSQVEAWASRVDPSDMYLSVITMMEAEIGILSLQRRDPAQATPLGRWFDEQVMPAFHARLLPVDLAVCAMRRHTARSRSDAGTRQPHRGNRHRLRKDDHNEKRQRFRADGRSDRQPLVGVIRLQYRDW